MKILFITRNYPPTVGGLERFSFQFVKYLKKELGRENVHVLANSCGHFGLFWFLPYAFFKALLIGKRFDIVHLADGSLCSFGWFFKKVLRVKVTTTIHGKDITLPFQPYQWYLKLFLSRLDFYFCVSRSTLSLLRAQGIDEERSCFIPNGIVSKEQGTKNKEQRNTKLKVETLGKSIFVNAQGDNSRLYWELKQEFLENVDIERDRFIISVGTLVERKGYGWFIENVMRRISKLASCKYLMVGGLGTWSRKDEVERLLRTIEDNNLGQQVFYLGRLSDEDVRRLYSICDVFVMPNIHVKNDVEGFGISPLEASSQGLIVIASNLQGISDAILDGKNGFLVEPESAEAFAEKICEVLNWEEERLQGTRESFRKFTIENYGWEKIIKQYIARLCNTLDKEEIS